RRAHAAGGRAPHRGREADARRRARGRADAEEAREKGSSMTGFVPVANHLWQSTLFAAIIALATLAFRRNRASVRHALWLAASMKFLVPFAALIALGGAFGARARPPILQRDVTM